ncbi:hypothetical protein MMC30_005218 [Trapelia coarctata]|nr:hypothetical protein [Trapelia coarctata]
MKFSEGTDLAFYIYQLPDDFGLTFELPTGLASFDPLVVEPEQFGVVAIWDFGKGLIVEQASPPVNDMSKMNYLDRLNDDDTLREAKSSGVNESYIRFGDSQLCLECNCYGDHRLIQCTSNFASQQHRALDSGQSLQRAFCQRIFQQASVKSRLIAAKGIEEAFQEFVGQKRLEGNWTGPGAKLLGKIEDAMAKHVFWKTSLNRLMNKRSLPMMPPSQVLKSMRKTWRSWERFSRKESISGVPKKAAKGAFWACVGIFAAIAATVASAGADAPAAGAAVAGAVNAGSAVAQIIATLQRIYASINGIYEKLEPTLQKLKEFSAVMEKVVAAIQQAEKIVAGQVGIHNATAEWNKFNIEVGMMWEALSSYDIEGKREYLTALRTVAINGTIYLQTQEYRRVFRPLTNVDNQAAVLDILKRAMFDRLITIRSFVFLAFTTYAEASMFHALPTQPSISIYPVKPVVDYLKDAAKIQGSVSAFGSTVMVQQYKFTIRTLGDPPDVESLCQQLRRKGTVRVSIGPDHEAFQGLCLIRVSPYPRVRNCYLEGARPLAPATTPPLRLHLRTSRRFSDLCFPTTQSPVPYVGAFVGDVRKLLFEYDLADGTICLRWRVRAAERLHAADTADGEGHVGRKMGG